MIKLNLVFTRTIKLNINKLDLQGGKVERSYIGLWCEARPWKKIVKRDANL